MRGIASALASVLLVAALPKAASAATAIDPTAAGPWQATYAEYKFSASIDPTVTSYAETELWARVWYPTGGATNTFPVVLMLHGEHGTCGRPDGGGWYIDDSAQYSSSGTCPAGYRVTPNHWGYDYVASRLATAGYMVVSINANRGVNQTPEVPAEYDPYNILRRGRLILRHLEHLVYWNTHGGSPTTIPLPLQGKLDLSRVSLVGHSRGGEAILAAYRMAKDPSTRWPAELPGVKIVALAAIAPTDFLADKSPVRGVPYGVLLPMCDGDLIRLPGVKVYDRAVAPATPDSPGNFKTTFATWGANHNGYNSEWHTSDTYSFGNPQSDGTHTCPGQNKLFPTRGTSLPQQEIGRYFVMAMVRGNSESPYSYTNLLNPDYTLPAPLKSVTRIDRGFFPGASPNEAEKLFDADVKKAGDCAKKLKVTEEVVGSCGVPPEHDGATTSISRLLWGKPAAGTSTDHKALFEIGVADLSKRKTLELRVAPDCKLANTSSFYGCSAPSVQGTGKGSQNIRVALQDDKGKFSKYVSLSNYTERREAVGVNRVPKLLTVNPEYHAILSSARVPLSEFGRSLDLKRVKRIWFDLSAAGSSGGIMLGDVWASTRDASAIRIAAKAQPAAETAETEEEDLLSLPVEDAPEVRRAETGMGVEADPGYRIVSAARRTLSRPDEAGAGRTRTEAVVELTVASPRDLIEASAGFSMRLGDRTIPVRRTGMSGDGTKLTTFTVPESFLAGAADGAGLAIGSGGSLWRFGPLYKSIIR